MYLNVYSIFRLCYKDFAKKWFDNTQYCTHIVHIIVRSAHLSHPFLIGVSTACVSNFRFVIIEKVVDQTSSTRRRKTLFLYKTNCFPNHKTTKIQTQQQQLGYLFSHSFKRNNGRAYIRKIPLVLVIDKSAELASKISSLVASEQTFEQI